MLNDWAGYRTRFVKVMPVEYRRALREMEEDAHADGSRVMHCWAFTEHRTMRL